MRSFTSLSRSHARSRRPIPGARLGRLVGPPLGLLLGFGFLMSSAALAQSQRYELLTGSKLVDDCRDCDRAPIVHALEGELTLEVIPSFVCCVWEIRDIELSNAESTLAITGRGIYSTNEIGSTTQRIELELAIAGVEGGREPMEVSLTSGEGPIGAPAPIIDITATEDGSRDPFHVFTITLVVAPKTKDRVAYELIPQSDTNPDGSFVSIDCPNCLVLDPVMPLEGRFELARVSVPASPFEVYAVDELELQAISDLRDLVFTGGGSFEHGGEVALLARMRLRVCVNENREAIVLESPREFPRAEFPEIVIDVDEGELHKGFNYRLHLVARPVSSPATHFRRGDTNDDGSVDLSDAVRIFQWLFGGATAPDCLDAANVDGSDMHDISDGVFLLTYLFRGGERPPEPGPANCGVAPAPMFGCERSAACE